MREITLVLSAIGLFAIFNVAQAADPTEAEISSFLGNPNDLSGLTHSGSHKGYQQFDFDTVDIEKLKQQKGKLYSSKEDVMKVLTGGVKNPTGKKEIWKEGLLERAIRRLLRRNAVASHTG